MSFGEGVVVVLRSITNERTTVVPMTRSNVAQYMLHSVRSRNSLAVSPRVAAIPTIFAPVIVRGPPMVWFGRIELAQRSSAHVGGERNRNVLSSRHGHGVGAAALRGRCCAHREHFAQRVLCERERERSRARLIAVDDDHHAVERGEACRGRARSGRRAERGLARRVIVAGDHRAGASQDPRCTDNTVSTKRGQPMPMFGTSVLTVSVPPRCT